MEKDDKGSTMIRMGVSGCPGSKAVKRLLLLLLLLSDFAVKIAIAL